MISTQVDGRVWCACRVLAGALAPGPYEIAETGATCDVAELCHMMGSELVPAEGAPAGSVVAFPADAA